MSIVRSQKNTKKNVKKKSFFFWNKTLIIEINENIVDQPELINSSPYNDGWIACIEFDASIDEVKTLSSEEYLKFIGK